MKRAYINGIILDGSENMQPQKGMSIITDGEKIVGIVPAGSEGADCEKVDLGGKYIMPGLINLHLHLPASGRPKKKQADNTKLVKAVTSTALMRRVVEIICAANAKTQLMSGVTTIRTVGGIMEYDGKIRDGIKAGKYVGASSRRTWRSPCPAGIWQARLRMRRTAPRRRKILSRRLLPASQIL